MTTVPTGRQALATLPASGRLLAVDVGDVRTGLAVSDPDQLVATPLETVPAAATPAGVVDAVLAATAEHAVAAIVVGYPRTLAGREGDAARRARQIAEAFADRCGVPVVLWDERFTTVEAERTMLAQDASRRERRAAVDRVAASLILQGVLEARRGGGPWR